MQRVSIGQVVAAIAAMGGKGAPDAIVRSLGSQPVRRVWNTTGPHFPRKAKRYRGGKWVTRTRHFRVTSTGSGVNYMNAGLRLYALRVVGSDELARREDGTPYYFSSKRRAKTARNQVSAETGVKFSVILGPDHKRSDPRRSYD